MRFCDVAARSSSALSLVGILLSTAPGCGSKTGLELPDAEADGHVDASDAGHMVRCIEVPAGGVVDADLLVPVTLAVVDVFFLIDATASMIDEIDNVQSRLRSRVVPGVSAAIPDAAFGVALLGEFPVDPHGPRGVSPYELRVPITNDIRAVEAALGRVPSWGNFDDPEAQVEALYQVATGEGLGSFIPPLPGCPMGGLGGVCFRLDSLPVVVLITDAPFHDGPDGEDPYTGVRPRPHTYAQAVEALRGPGIFVMGLGARDAGRPSPMPHLRRLARDTGAVDEDGDSLAFDIGARGDRVGEGIIEAIGRLASGLLLDVDAVTQDVPGDALDARDLISEVRPLASDPADGVGGVEAGRFVGVRPGTRLTFRVVVDVSGLPPSESTRRVPARIIFRAFGRSRLGQDDVVIVIPGEDHGGC